MKRIICALVFACLGLSRPPLPPAAADRMPPAARPATISSACDNLPLTFEENQGQVDKHVRFLTRGTNGGLFLTSHSAVFALSNPGRAGAEGPRGAVVRLSLLGANSAPRILGEEAQPGMVNYLHGGDPSRWHTHIPTFGRVRYGGVYPGVDLIYYGSRRRLEYDFVVSPAADTKVIRLALDGVQGVHITPRGDLRARTAAGDITWRKPVVYQERQGVRIPVTGSYICRGKVIGFQIGPHDARRPLVIDPVLAYSTLFGNLDGARAVAVDSAGNAYVTGVANSLDFPLPTTSGAFRQAPQGESNAFVTKVNPHGTGMVYTTYIGGAAAGGFGGGFALAVDTGGDAFVAGATSAGDFPTVSPVQAHLRGVFNAFVSKLNADGSGLLYSTYLGGSALDAAFGLALDGSGAAYITGMTASSDFPATAGAFQTRFGANSNAFVTKLSPSGSSLVYSTFLGGSAGGTSVSFTDMLAALGTLAFNDAGLGIAVDAGGNACVTGLAGSSNFPTKSPAQAALHGATNAFVTKLNPSGSALVYSTYLGGSHGGEAVSLLSRFHSIQVTMSDAAVGIALDSGGNAYVTGETLSSDFPVTAGAFQPHLNGVGNAFVAKYGPTGAEVYATYLGGSGVNNDGGGDVGAAIAVDAAGAAYVVGDTASPDFPVTPGAVQGGYVAQPGGAEGFFAKLSPGGSALSYATYLGGTGVGGDLISGIALDSTLSAYVVGVTGSQNFPTTLDAFQTQFGDFIVDGYVSNDGFITKISPTGPLTLTALSTLSAPAGGPDLPLTVTGTGFGPNSTLSFDGQALPTTFSSATQLEAAIPAADISGSGPTFNNVNVVDTSTDGGISNGLVFTVTNPTPAISGLSPFTTQPGTTGLNITITGRGFTRSSTADFNGSPRPTSYNALDGTLTVAPLPTDFRTAGKVQITAVNPAPGGGTSSGVPFFVAVPHAGRPHLVVTATLQRIAANQVVADYTFTNTGVGDALNVTVSGNPSDLSGHNADFFDDAASALPYIVGTIPAGASAMLEFNSESYDTSFPPPGTLIFLRLAGSYTGGAFSSELRVTIPAALPMARKY